MVSEKYRQYVESFGYPEIAALPKAEEQKFTMPQVANVSALDSEKDRLAFSMVGESPTARKELLANMGFNPEQIKEPSQSPTGEWSILNRETGIYYPVDPKGFQLKDLPADIAESLPAVGKGVVETVGTTGGALAGLPLGPAGALGGGFAGGVASGAGAEYGMQKLARKLYGLKTPVSAQDVAAEAALSGITGLVPGSVTAAKGAFKGAGKEAMEQWGKTLAGKAIKEAPETLYTSLARKSTQNLTREELEQASKLSVEDIVAAKFKGLPKSKMAITSDVYGGLDDSLVTHLEKRTAEGIDVPLTQKAISAAPEKISNIIPKMQENIDRLQRYAKTQWANTWNTLSPEIKGTKIAVNVVNEKTGLKGLKPLIEEIKSYDVEVAPILKRVGLGRVKNSYTLDELKTLKDALAKEVKLSKSYGKVVQPFTEPPLTKSLRAIDGAIRGHINEVPQMKSINKLYGEIMENTRELDWRLDKRNAETMLARVAAPDFKQAIVEPVQRLEALGIKHSKAGAKPFYDDLMDAALQYKSSPKKRIPLPFVEPVSHIPGVGKLLGMVGLKPEVSAPTFGRIVKGKTRLAELLKNLPQVPTGIKGTAAQALKETSPAGARLKGLLQPMPTTKVLAPKEAEDKINIIDRAMPQGMSSRDISRRYSIPIAQVPKLMYKGVPKLMPNGQTNLQALAKILNERGLTS